MILGKTYRQRKRVSGLWFAWYPIKLVDGRWVWLVQVERICRGTDDFIWYDYELTEK